MKSTSDKVFVALTKQYPGLRLRRYFDNGSTARVYLVDFPIGPMTTKRIVKVFRHEAELMKALGTEKVFKNEVMALLATSHSNLVSIYAADFLQVGGVKTPFYVMEYLPEACDLDEWVRRNAKSTSREQILELLIQAALGIRALHAINRLHCDIKFGNLLVGHDGTLKVADLGFSKVINLRNARMTCVYTTLENLPRSLVKNLEQMKDRRAAAVTISSSELDTGFDLHYYGRTLEKLIGLPEVVNLLSGSDRAYLKLMCARLDMDDSGPELSRYASADEVIADLRKIQKVYLRRAGVEELNLHTGTQSVRIPVSGSIFASDRVTKLINHPLVQRLNRVLQLGFTYYVYPGASHTRFEHSLGVYGQIAAQINALLTDDAQPYFRQVIDEEKICTALIAGLLHDLGQHSFAHTFEDFDLAERHEDVAMKLITGHGAQALIGDQYAESSVASLLRRDWPEVNLEALRWLIAGKTANTDIAENRGWQMTRALLSGPLDADKTDYLRRDAHHAGVEYGRGIDVVRLVNSLTGCLVGEHQQGSVGVTWKGIQAAENLIVARAQMFWVVYWHHAVRAANAMLAYACASHLKRVNARDGGHFNRVLFTGSAHELLRFLTKSIDPRARDLARGLLDRRLYKRGIELNYADDRELYNDLSAHKRSVMAKDKTLTQLAGCVAVEASRVLANKGNRTRLNRSDVLVDIPPPDKDELGRIYVVHRNGRAEEYSSRLMSGAQEDWQNWVRTSRVFVHDRIDRQARQIIHAQSKTILAKALLGVGV